MHAISKAIHALLPAFAAACIALPSGLAAETATDLKCKGCVAKKDIAKNAVDGTRIKDDSIKPADMHRLAKPGGVDGFDGGPSSIPVTGTFQSIVSVTVTAPTAGFVAAFADWYFAGLMDDEGRCFLATAAGEQSGPQRYTVAGTANYRDNASLTRVFQVPAGDTEFHLNCGNGVGNMSVTFPSITAMFFPNRY